MANDPDGLSNQNNDPSRAERAGKIILVGGGTGSSFASAISDCNTNHILIIVAIAAPIPTKVLILTLKPVSSFNSLAITNSLENYIV